MDTTYRAELTAAVASLSDELDALRAEAIRLNAELIGATRTDSVILCAHAEGVQLAIQRTFEQWNATRAELRNEQDL